MAKEKKTNRGGARQGAGRKRDGNELRDIRVMTRISGPTFIKLQEKALKYDLSLSTFLQKLIEKDLLE